MAIFISQFLDGFASHFPGLSFPASCIIDETFQDVLRYRPPSALLTDDQLQLA